MPRVVVTGATGLVGSALCRALRERGDEVVAITRDPARAAARLPAGARAEPWDAIGVAADGAAAVVNLAGESIGARWSEARKRAIRASRIGTTRRVVEAVAAAGRRPAVLVSASAVGCYGPCPPDREVHEDAPAGGDFLARLCADWEAEALRARDAGARVVLLRTGIVLGAGGGALGRMWLPFSLGIGGPIGSGRQAFPWIHVADEVGAILHALDRPEVSGPINAVAPEAVSQREFAAALGHTLGRPARLPLPGFALRAAFGEMADMLLTGQRCVPARLRETGYRFVHPDLHGALAAVVATRRAGRRRAGRRRAPAP